jgi:hypothetical protein
MDYSFCVAYSVFIDRKNTLMINEESIMKKTVLKVAKITGVTVLILIILGSIGISIFTGTQVAKGLVYQNEGKDTKETSIDQLDQWNYDYETFESKYSVDKSSVVAKDDTVVPFVRIGKNEVDSNKTVVLIHGLGGDSVSVYPQAEMYLENGWNVIAIDQRASGDSKNKWVTFGYYEKLDVEAVVDYVKEELKQETIIVHGFSMGGATAGLYAGTEHANESVNAIVMDSSFESMKSMFLLVWEDAETGIPTDYAIGCGDIVLRLKYGFNFDDADVTKGLITCKVPILIIQSEQDKLVPDEMAVNMIDAIQHNKKEIWRVDSKHIEGYIDYPVEYEGKVMSFLGEQIR